MLTSHSDVTLAHVLLVSLGACSQKVQLFELWSTSCRRPSHLSTLRTKPDLQFDQDMVNIIHIYIYIYTDISFKGFFCDSLCFALLQRGPFVGEIFEV